MLLKSGVQVSKILVTGGAGFIGTNFVNNRLNKNLASEKIIVLDSLTYAGNSKNLKQHPNLFFVKGDIRDRELVTKLMSEVNSVINFAAESHVDRSIDSSEEFISTNVQGTLNLLNAAMKSNIDRFIQISTDEVYGSIEIESATELSLLQPNSPYSASKAGAELVSRSFFKTYGLPIIITRSSNNFGPFQNEEKFLPKIINSIIKNKSIPIYGDGKNIRDWLYVEDNCNAIELVLDHGVIGEVYNIGGRNELSNLDLVERVIQVMGKGKDLIEYVTDRKGHDYRYSLDITKIEKELGFKPITDFETGLKSTIQWYLDN